MSNLPTLIKNKFWYFAVPGIPILVFTLLFIANSQPIAVIIDSKFIRFNNLIESLTLVYAELLPSSIANTLTEALISVRENYIINQLFRTAIFTNFSLAMILIIKGFADTIKALTSLSQKESFTIRVFLPFTYLLKNKSNEKPWGLVYDAITKKPIDPAVVTIATHENSVGEFKQTRITDINGRFNF